MHPANVKYSSVVARTVSARASIGEARRKLPREFMETLSSSFPQALVEAILRGMGAPRLTTLRANTLRSSTREIERFLRDAAVKFRRVPWCPEAFVLVEHRERDAQAWEVYQDGRIYLQSLSSMVPALALEPQPGESVLDIAAAPGSKTTQMAAMMENNGSILAVELNAVRAERLRYNVGLQGCRIVEVRTGRGEKIAAEMPGRFDRVLIDVPCSGEGRFLVGDPASSRGWSARTVTECARLQRKLIASGANALKPGGVLVYSTCTLNLEENERIIQWALETLPLKTEKVPVSIPGSFAGMTRGLSPEVGRALRLMPDSDKEGFFVCRMRRTG